VMKKLAGDCSGWRMAGGIFLTVTCGGGSRLCHDNDVPAYWDRRGSMGGGSKSFLEAWWSCLNDRRGVGAAECRGLMGEDDRAGLVRYANFSANFRVLAHGRHTCVASCRTVAPGRISCVLFLFCSRTPGPQPARAWPVALHAHMPAESSRAGHRQNVPACTYGRARPIPPKPPGPAIPPPSPPVVMPSGPAYHRRRSCAARRTRAALLLPRPPRVAT
jgi:hypothetical protein